MLMVDINHFNFDIVRNAKNQKRGRGNIGTKRRKVYRDLWCAFDIEATTIPGEDTAIMYVWQFQVDEFVTVFGRTWDQFLTFIKKLKAVTGGAWLVCYVHNLSYEFSFLKGIYNFTENEVFAIERRKILKCEMMDFLELRCSYLHSNMNLEAFTRRWAVHHKESGKKFNYKKVRYPWTRLTRKERKYIQYDVLGLVEAIKNQALYDGHNLYNIPLTSTGYVRIECKRRMKGFNHTQLYKCLPDSELLPLLVQAFRGGNTHANRYYSGKIIKNVKSFDISSSYPSQMLYKSFPMGPWIKLNAKRFTIDNFIELLHEGNAVLIQFKVWNVELDNPLIGNPYLAKHKCNISGSVEDNGRILHADYLDTIMTDLDFRIFLNQYKFDDLIITGLYISKYGPMPEMIRDYILELFRAKTELKGVDELGYLLSKERINSLYGMSVQNILKNDIKYRNGEFIKEDFNIIDRVEKNNKKAFQSYAWGVWVTSHARYQLQEGLELVGEKYIYCDTDSIKFEGSADFEKLNNPIREKAEKVGGLAKDQKGVAHYLGVWEEEEGYKEFKTLGAKRYAYTYNSGKNGVTVSGVNKKIGPIELWSRGGLEAFNDGFIFRKAGGTESVYNDKIDEWWEIEGHRLHITDNVVIKDSTYTLGLTGDYLRIIQHPALWLEEWK